jgi:hypothetical protein
VPRPALVNYFRGGSRLTYPEQEHRDFSIVLASRYGVGMAARFRVAVMTFQASDRTWQMREEPMPPNSASLLVQGSGASEIRAAERLWQASDHAHTSRAVFSAFCESMQLGGDPSTGGGPQLVGLHRVGNGKNFGVVFRGRRYLSGAVIDRKMAAASTTLWFNERFERCNGERMARLSTAQPHRRR